MRNDDASIEAQLRASRARLLASADAERRELERALHDGIQQDLVALAVKLQLARQLAGSEPDAAERLLDEIRDDVRDALEGVRALSERVYPSLLAARGLAEALRGLAAAARIPIRIEDLGRYPPEVEGTVYFCCREALESAIARGAHPTLRVWQEDDTLRFEIADARSDVADVRDRVETLGGQLTIVSETGGGTRVSAAIPVR
jgi:signal transduction histidine kinase